jgi:UDP-glucose:(heptosyl)LPS alpha-1,3-glucosyltransferase
MRVALSSPDVNTVGGIERVVTETANWLSRKGHEVSVYAARVDSEVLDEAVRVRRVPVPAKLDLLGVGFRGRAQAAIAADHPDVHGAFSTLSPLGGVYWIPSVHRVAYELLLEWRTPVQRLPVRFNPFHRIRLRQERAMFAAGGCARLLVAAEAVKLDVMRLYGVAGRDIAVLPLGFDPRAFDAGCRANMRDEIRRRLGYGPDDRVLVFVANELERKGFGVLLDAVARLEDARVKVLGAGRLAPDAYRGQIERLGLTERIRWEGSSADIGALHAASDVFVLPSRYEAWGLVIVEALGSGLPVVTSRLAGAAIAVRDRETGWLLDDPENPAELAEALRWALSSAPAESRAISDSVREYTWEELVSGYERVLRTVVDGVTATA